MSTETLTRGEALELVNAAEQIGALGYLAAHWDIPGHWNENAEWDWSTFDQFIDEHCQNGEQVRGHGPSDSDPTDLTACDFL
jgi:hypothetical protein